MKEGLPAGGHNLQAVAEHDPRCTGHDCRPEWPRAPLAITVLRAAVVLLLDGVVSLDDGVLEAADGAVDLRHLPRVLGLHMEVRLVRVNTYGGTGVNTCGTLRLCQQIEPVR